MKTPNYLAKLPQETTIKKIETLRDYDRITLHVPAPKQRLCPYCGSTDCIIKDSGAWQTVRHIPYHHRGGSPFIFGVSPFFPVFFLISPAFRGELLVFLVSYDNSLFSWCSPAFREALLVFLVFFSHRQNSANPPDGSEAFLLRQIVRPGAFNAVPDPHVMMIFVNDYEIFSKEV